MARLSIGPKRSLIYLERGGQMVLFKLTEHGITIIPDVAIGGFARVEDQRLANLAPYVKHAEVRKEVVEICFPIIQRIARSILRRRDDVADDLAIEAIPKALYAVSTWRADAGRSPTALVAYSCNLAMRDIIGRRKRATAIRHRAYNEFKCHAPTFDAPPHDKLEAREKLRETELEWLEFGRDFVAENYPRLSMRYGTADDVARLAWKVMVEVAEGASYQSIADHLGVRLRDIPTLSKIVPDFFQ